MLGVVYVGVQGKTATVAAIREAIDGRLEIRVVQDGFPETWDFYVVRTGLSVAVEQAAMDCKAMLVILPTWRDLFAKYVLDRAETQDAVWIFAPGRAGELPPPFVRR